MTISKTNNSKSVKKSTNGQLSKEYLLIDKVLQDQPEKVKQQVWEFVARFNIHPDDEAFWAMFIVMGYMQLLLTESPEQWKVLFEKFEGELGSWAQSNNKTLEQLTQKTEVMKLLSQSSEKLESILVQLVGETHKLMLTLQQQTVMLNSLLLQLQQKGDSVEKEQSASKEQQSRDEGIMKTLKSLVNHTKALSAQLQQAPKETAPRREIPQIVLVILLVTGTGLNMSMTHRANSLLEKTHQQSSWLLKKANRQDCLAGIKKPNSPECRSLK